MDELDKVLGIPTTASPLPDDHDHTARLTTTNKTTTIVLSKATCLRPHGRGLLVGRQAATADIRIQHGSISRQHAVFFYVDSQLHLTSLGGKFGTLVNENAIHDTVRLRHGDMVQFGNVRESVFVVHLPEAMSAVSASTITNHTQELLAQAGQGLSGRDKRAAEIAAMMESLDAAPQYQTYVPTASEQQTERDQDDASLSIDDKTLRRASKYGIPVAQHLNISSESDRPNMAATCLAMDPSGARFIVGSRDTFLRLYDFGGMDRSRQLAFQSIIPEDGHIPVAACYSTTGDRFLVATGSVQPKLYSRDGEELLQFVRGDMYVTDVAKTKGHTGAVTCVAWHPHQKDVVLTGALDGSVRVWNVVKGQRSFDNLTCDKVLPVKNIRGQRNPVASMALHPNGVDLAVGTLDGNIQIWNKDRAAGRPERVLHNAHDPGRAVTCVAYNSDGTHLLSRSADDTRCHVWNPQRLSRSSTPVMSCDDVPTVHECAMTAWSPDDATICVGTSEVHVANSVRYEQGKLKFYKVIGSKGVISASIHIELPAGVGPIAICWHERLLQIVLTASDGRTCVYYDPTLSNNGALLVHGRVGRSADELQELLQTRAPQGSAALTGEIVTPFAQPRGSAAAMSEKKRKREERKDPVKSREPERPASGKHKAGSQVGGTTTFQQYVADQRNEKTSSIAGQDPREALLKYQDGKSYLGKETKILADRTVEQEEEGEKKKQT